MIGNGSKGCGLRSESGSGGGGGIQLVVDMMNTTLVPGVEFEVGSG